VFGKPSGFYEALPKPIVRAFVRSGILASELKGCRSQVERRIVRAINSAVYVSFTQQNMR
jgi:hypothetical protein